MSTTSRARGWRNRLTLLAAMTLLFTVPVVLASQTPASASVTTSSFAGSGTAGFYGDGGAATSAQLNQPQGVVADNVGNVYIFDSGNHRIREVSGGNISTMSGDGSICDGSSLGNLWSFDVGGICSSSYPLGFGGGPGGVMYISNSGVLEQVYSGVKAHVAGKVGGNYVPGDGTDFGVNVSPNSLASGNGDVYFAGPSTSGYPGNSLKMWSQGSGINTVAGMSSTSICNYFPSNGQAALGACIHPQYLTLWSHYLYFFDSSPGWQGPEIFRIDLSESTKYLTKVAGSGSFSDYGADGSLAVNDGISHVGPIAIDNNGNLFFGSSNSGSIREVDTSGKLWNVTDIGANQNSYAFDAYNNLYVSEPSNNKVVKVTGLDSVTSKGNLVALGDSVAAGEGINYGFMWNPTTGAWNQSGSSSPTWTDTSASLGSNFQQCHQSDYAYPRYFSGPYDVFNMSCSGASVLQEPGVPGGSSGYTSGGIMSLEVFAGGTAMPAELGSSDTPVCSGCNAANPLFDSNLTTSGIVLLQVGADDVDFSNWVQRCYMTNSACGTSDQSTLNAMLTQETADLRVAATELNARAGQNGYSSSHKLRLVVADYYNPYGSTFDSGCVDSGHSASWPAITSGQQTFIVNGLASLDSNINSEVQYAQVNDLNLNVSMVDLAGLFPGGQDIMAGHTFCTANPWVYGPSIDYPNWQGVLPAVPNFPSPMHPTPDGQMAIYNAIMQQAGL